MKKTNKKRLIVSGCSFTAASFKSVLEPDVDCSFPKWPEVFNNLTENQFELENLGKCGYGNEYIYKKAISSILKNPDDVGLVIIALSETSRFSFGIINEIYSARFYNLIEDINNIDDYMKMRDDNKWNEHVCKIFDQNNSYSSISTIVDSILVDIMRFQMLCNSLNIPYIIVPMLPQLDMGIREAYSYKTKIQNIWTHRNVSKTIISNHMYDLVDDSKIMFWPFIQSLGGTDFHTILKDDERIGKIDKHPNEKGHEKIAKTIFEFYKQNL